MARTTSAAVELIIETDVSISLTPFIEVANSLVTNVCSSDTDYDDTLLELIERWLSAHFYAVRESRFKSQRAGSVSEEIQTKVDLGLDVTHYGQQAKLIDYKGHLAALDKKAKEGLSGTVGVSYMGKTEAEAEDDSIS